MKKQQAINADMQKRLDKQLKIWSYKNKQSLHGEITQLIQTFPSPSSLVQYYERTLYFQLINEDLIQQQFKRINEIIGLLIYQINKYYYNEQLFKQKQMITIYFRQVLILIRQSLKNKRYMRYKKQSTYFITTFMKDAIIKTKDSFIQIKNHLSDKLLNDKSFNNKYQQSQTLQKQSLLNKSQEKYD